MKGRRSNIDFSKHELTVIKNESVLIHRLKKPGTNIDSFTFINTQDVCTVTGDYGNYVFCREFHPSKKGAVSDYYWIEKLESYSEQEGLEFDAEATRKELEEGLEIGLEDYGHNGESLVEAKEYYEELLNHLDNESIYCAHAFTERPHFIDFEYVPLVKKVKNRLKYVFDAFEEICERCEE